jgi:hypothetical protein
MEASLDPAAAKTVLASIAGKLSAKTALRNGILPGIAG